MNLTSVNPIMDKVNRIQRKSSVPKIIERVGDAGLLNGNPILEPNQTEKVQRSSIGDALEFSHGLLPDDGDVPGRDDDLGGHVEVLLVRVHLQGDVVAVLLLAQLSVGGSGSEIVVKY